MRCYVCSCVTLLWLFVGRVFLFLSFFGMFKRQGDFEFPSVYPNQFYGNQVLLVVGILCYFDLFPLLQFCQVSFLSSEEMKNKEGGYNLFSCTFIICPLPCPNLSLHFFSLFFFFFGCMKSRGSLIHFYFFIKGIWSVNQ